MAPMTLGEKTETRTYGLLSSRVSEALSSFLTSRSLPDTQERQIYTEGQRLLDRFIEGSRFVEGEKLEKGVAPSPDSIKAFKHALSTLRQLRWENESVSKVLSSVRDSLRGLEQAKKVEELDENRLKHARAFFVALSSLLSDDLARSRLEESVPRRSTTTTSESSG